MAFSQEFGIAIRSTIFKESTQNWWTLPPIQVCDPSKIQQKIVAIDRKPLDGSSDPPMWVNTPESYLGGGFKYFLFSPLLGEMIQFD